MIIAIMGWCRLAIGFARARPRLVAGLAAGAAFALLLALVYHRGVADERTRWTARLAREAAASAERAARASARSDAQARIDAASVAADVEELDHADDAVPDERPGAKSRAFDCERLRRAGVATTGLGCPG